MSKTETTMEDADSAAVATSSSHGSAPKAAKSESHSTHPAREEPHEEDLAAAVFISQTVASIAAQAVDQAVDPTIVVAAVLTIACKLSRSVCGPAGAAAALRQLADQVEADVAPAGRH